MHLRFLNAADKYLFNWLFVCFPTCVLTAPLIDEVSETATKLEKKQKISFLLVNRLDVIRVTFALGIDVTPHSRF
jgi:hypothetical protein